MCLRESGYYPPGAEYDDNAPYNKEEVQNTYTITIVMSTTIDVNTPNKEFTQKELKSIVEQEIMVPYLDKNYEDWDLDEINIC